MNIFSDFIFEKEIFIVLSSVTIIFCVFIWCKQNQRIEILQYSTKTFSKTSTEKLPSEKPKNPETILLNTVCQ